MQKRDKGKEKIDDHVGGKKRKHWANNSAKDKPTEPSSKKAKTAGKVTLLPSFQLTKDS